MRELVQASQAMRAASPVFIVGEARSGSSLLYRTVQKHPSFRPKAQNLVETEVFAHLRRPFLFSPEYPDSFRRFMLDDARAYTAFVRPSARLGPSVRWRRR